MRNLDGVRLVQYEDYRLDLEETKGDSSNKICTVYYGRYPESKLLMVIHCDIYKNLIETYAQQESFPLDPDPAAGCGHLVCTSQASTSGVHHEHYSIFQRIRVVL